jgi:hypothetical protein
MCSSQSSPEPREGEREYRVVTEVWKQTQPTEGPRQWDSYVRPETPYTYEEARRLAEKCSPPKFKSATVQSRVVGPWSSSPAPGVDEGAVREQHSGGPARSQAGPRTDGHESVGGAS